MAERRAAAGWYDHPTMAETQRYWDGEAWTSHIAPGKAHVIDVETGVPEAERVAGALNVVKWTLVSLIAILTVSAATLTVVDYPRLGLSSKSALVATAVTVLLGTLYGLFVWIALGLAQHSLAMLTLIARNTSRR